MSDEHVPFRLQYIEGKLARVIDRQLREKEKLAKSSGAAMPAGPVTRRIDPPTRSKAPSRYAAPADPHFHVEMERGAPVKVKVDGELHHGKILDWNDEHGGVTVQTHAGIVRARRHHLRPLTDDELRRHREQEERDQERAGIVTTRYTTEDLMPGFRVVCLDDDDREVAGTIKSISHDRPAHVVIHGGRGINGHRLKVFTVDRIVQVLEGDGR